MRRADATDDDLRIDHKARRAFKQVLFSQIISCVGSIAVFIGTLGYHTPVRNILPTDGASFNVFKGIIISIAVFSLMAKLISCYIQSAIVGSPSRDHNDLREGYESSSCLETADDKNLTRYSGGVG
jgi:hypothetical protein